MYDIIKLAGFLAYDQKIFFLYGMLLIISELQPVQAFGILAEKKLFLNK